MILAKVRFQLYYSALHSADIGEVVLLGHRHLVRNRSSDFQGLTKLEQSIIIKCDVFTRMIYLDGEMLVPCRHE